ncbi:MAG TPA: hypothetical protein VN840_09395 [Streptosporangiaceae bacterium]|nr:hypothetical protein [Streptosporangiaceae bacterium]
MHAGQERAHAGQERVHAGEEPDSATRESGAARAEPDRAGREPGAGRAEPDRADREPGAGRAEPDRAEPTARGGLPGDGPRGPASGEGWLDRETDLSRPAGDLRDGRYGWPSTGRLGQSDGHWPWFMSGDSGAPWFVAEPDQRDPDPG